ncbi:uncharacterized protein PG986_000645 [Apiospora aurea]|uniref:Uncharacterized protein n=1 Tax=Apiospora aurea TaxID=335848 RepID=A0ABR1QUP3_9PEZI
MAHESAIPTADSPAIDDRSLLGVPLEIRRQIYKHFVTIDQDFEHEGDAEYHGECIGVAILHVNRQIREEAWDDLITMNLWIRVSVAESTNSATFRLPDLDEQCQSFLPYNRASGEHSERLAKATAIHLWIGESDAADDNGDLDSSRCRESVMVAYHPLHYSMFLDNLAGNVAEFGSLTIQVHPDAMSNKSRFEKLLEPLCVLRGVENVSFAGVEDCAALQSLAQDMRRPLLIADEDSDEDTDEDNEHRRTDILELIKIQQYHQRLGRNAELQGRYSDAMCHYQVGGWVQARFPEADGRLEGSLEYNTCLHLATELHLGCGRSTHKYVTQTKRLSPDSTLYSQALPETIQACISSCSDALEFIGLSDPQRREAQLYRAFALFHVAEYLNTLSRRDRRSSPYLPTQYYRRSSRGPGRRRHDHVGAARDAAARDLFYAKDVDPLHDILADLDEDDQATYRRIDDLLMARRFTIVNHEVPLLGTWSGDPDIWEDWENLFPQRWLLIKLFRMRLGQDSGGEEELEMEYADEGITWSRDSDELDITSESW